MVVQRRFVLVIILLCSIGWLVTACERPTPDESAGVTATAVISPDLSDPNVGGGVAGDAPVGDAPVGDAPVGDAPVGDASVGDASVGDAPTAAAAYPGTEEGAVSEAAQPTVETAVSPTVPTVVTPTTTTAAVTATAVPVEAVPPTVAPTAVPQPAAVAGERTHIVQPGENLFRIGLQYGVSWVTLAQFNGLSNPNDIRAGQTLRIPPTGTLPPTPTAVPPSNITYYTVQPGDNLYRIGQKFGVSWVQIAEANGLVNPNQIVVGQTLKIPVSAPGPTPEFTHVVKPGETIFGIAVQYGVPWMSVAEANDIQSPYVIYAGQTLVIPGG